MPYGFSTSMGYRYPAVNQMLVEEAYPRMVYRKLLIQHDQPNNDLFEIPIEVGDTSFVVNEVGEAQQIKIDNPKTRSTILKAFEIGEGFGITKNEMLFNKVDMVGFKPKKLGRKIGNTVDRFCAALISGSVPVANVVAATGQSLMNDGSTHTIAGGIGLNDLVRAIRILQDNEVPATDLVMNPIGWEYLNIMPQFKALNQWGDRGYMLGAVSAILGMRVHITKNCPAGEAHVIASTEESFSGQYLPTGFFCLVHDVQTESIYNPAKRQNEVYATMFFTAGIARAENLVKITYAGSPYGA